MAALFLREDDVRSLIDMPTAIDCIEQAFRELGKGTAVNCPRQRVRLKGLWLHTMAAGLPSAGLVGTKSYTTTADKARFLVTIWSAETGEPLALMEADWLGQLRTGAASGVATRWIARPDCTRVGIFGSGLQARTQLEAVCAVRPIAEVFVYSRSADRRQAFAKEMSGRLNIAVRPVDSPADCVRERDIVITATTSRTPLFDGQLLSPGTHLNAVGSNFLQKSELDRTTLARCQLRVCDHRQQCQLEAGDLHSGIEAGLFTWDSVVELQEIVTGMVSINRITDSRALAEGLQPETDPAAPGSQDELTLFKSVGLAIEDVAVAAEGYRRAKELGRGTVLPF